MAGVRKFCVEVQERAAAIGRLPDALRHSREHRLQKNPRIVGVLLLKAVPPSPKGAILFGDEGGDQGVLGLEGKLRINDPTALHIWNAVLRSMTPVAVQSYSCGRIQGLHQSHHFHSLQHRCVRLKHMVKSRHKPISGSGR
jgi:hypothetical protein